MELHELAEIGYNSMKVNVRQTTPQYGDCYISCKDDAPEWVRHMVREIHDELLPDDFIYDKIHSFLEYFSEEGADEEGAREYADTMVDVYITDLEKWVQSHSVRREYVNEAMREFEADTYESSLSFGQAIELNQIASQVFYHLEATLQDMEDDETGQ